MTVMADIGIVYFMERAEVHYRRTGPVMLAGKHNDPDICTRQS